VLVDKAVGKQSTVSASTLWGDESHVAQLLERLDRYAGRAWGVLFAGSLPAGVALDAYSRMVAHARQRGLITLLDTSGEALRLGIRGLPHILKINEVELAILDAGAAGLLQSTAATPAEESPRQIPGETIDMMHRLATALRPRLGVWATDAIVITLGALGALAITPTGAHHVRPPAVPIVNTAGAGDAVSGALLLALERGQSWAEAMRLGMAAAAAVVMSESIAFQDPAQVDALLQDVIEVEID
jgi:fructose-1-phosphate kinase PfkB-like protein